MSGWRSAGINYVRFSQLAAQLTRQCLKGEAKLAAEKKAGATIKITKWENGKALGKKE